MKSIFVCVAVAATAVLSQAAQAQAQAQPQPQDNGRIYVGVFLGDRLGNEQIFNGATLAGDPRHIQSPTKDGLDGGGYIGVIVADAPWGRLRTEAEISASKNSVDRLILNGQQRQLLQGRKSITATMLNFAYDTPRILDRLRFSAGAGVGAASIDYDIQYNVSPTGPTIFIPTNESGQLAYQLIGGASVDLTRHFALTADVRYLRVAEHKVERFNQSAGTLDSILDAKYHSTALTAGVRYTF